MNNENTWTQGRGHYTLGSIGVNRGGTMAAGWRDQEGITSGKMPNVDDGE